MRNELLDLTAIVPATACRQRNYVGTYSRYKKSKIYHLPDCPGYAGMNPASVVVFANEAAAEQAGYRKAKNCP